MQVPYYVYLGTKESVYIDMYHDLVSELRLDEFYGAWLTFTTGLFIPSSWYAIACVYNIEVTNHSEVLCHNSPGIIWSRP